MKPLSIDVNANLNCLIIQTKFSEFSYWNLNSVTRLVGFKAYTPPLGLLTVAAILPRHWNFKFIDLNIYESISEKDWEWCDILCIGGMLPQQEAILSILKEAGKRSKFRILGGADPSSQPDIYKNNCEALLLGEGESSIPLWIESAKSGKCTGIFKEGTKPELSLSPIPRWDLINIKDYYMIGVQFSRGCPHHCEFCSIVKLFGRNVRRKSIDQFLSELKFLYDLGYRGRVDIVDDNLGGNLKLLEKEFLPSLVAWNKKYGYPFSYSTEFSLNVADNDTILSLLEEANFTEVFVGIETPDIDSLVLTHKKINTMRPIKERVANFYKHGLIVHSGFILGFDSEKNGMDKVFIDFIKESGVILAMMGLLVALPNTDLYLRLEKEGRIIKLKDKDKDPSSSSESQLRLNSKKVKAVDQTTGGLNFKTIRDRKVIYQEFMSIIQNIYSIDVYFERIVRNILLLNKRKNLIFGKKINSLELHKILAFIKISFKISMMGPKHFWVYWKTIFYLLIKAPLKFESAMNYIALYPHYKKQTHYVLESISKIKDIEV